MFAVVCFSGALLRSVLPAQVSPPAPEQQAAPVAHQELDLAKGKEMFAGDCSGCHGAEGRGGDAPDIHGMPAKIGEAAVAVIIRRGVPGTGMPAFYGFNEIEAREIAAYLHSLDSAAPSEPIKGDPAKGRAVFERSGCSGCHMIAGQGGEIGPELTNIGSLRGVAALREAVLHPGANLPKEGNQVDRGRWTQYLMFRAVTKDGRTIEGMRVAEDTFAIVLKDGAGNFHSVQKLDLRSIEKEPGKSIMPSFQSSLSATDLDDLISYLASLKGTP